MSLTNCDSLFKNIKDNVTYSQWYTNTNIVGRWRFQGNTRLNIQQKYYIILLWYFN